MKTPELFKNDLIGLYNTKWHNAICAGNDKTGKLKIKSAIQHT